MENAALRVDRLSLFVGVKCFQNFGPHGTELLLQKLKKIPKIFAGVSIPICSNL